jgi:hypothetical protein|nr:MAG TPA: Mycobacterial 2 TMS Phage Holin (M2 Hol) Family [Caudoviricetes sp.]
MNETQRKAIYAFVTALIPVGIVYGIVTQEQAAVIVPAILAGLSLIMAYVHVPAPGDKQQDAPAVDDSERGGV